MVNQITVVRGRMEEGRVVIRMPTCQKLWSSVSLRGRNSSNPIEGRRKTWKIRATSRPVPKR